MSIVQETRTRRSTSLPRTGANGHPGNETSGATARSTPHSRVEDAVRLAQVSYTYPSAPTPAIADVDLAVEPGKVVALLGPNGAGKTTLVSLLLGMNRPGSGSIEVFGREPRAALRQGDIGAMLQSAGIAEHVTVTELIGFIAKQYPKPIPVEQALELAGLTDKARRRIERLSGGEQQRVRFALALVGNPRLLILDEPTNEMDVASRISFWNSVRDAARTLGRTVFFTTHHMDEVAAAADRVIVISDGAVIADETPEELRLRAGRTKVQFRWRTEPVDGWLDRLSSDVEFEAGPEVQTLMSENPDQVLRELVTRVPEAADLKILEASLDEAYLSVISDGR